MNKKFDKWNKWLESIYKEIINLSSHRHIYKEVAIIINKNPRIQKPSSFYEFLEISYTTALLNNK